MTDQEIITLCAEAMEPRPTLPGSSLIWGYSKEFVKGTTETWVRSTYNPLQDDAQAMALVKRFRMDVKAFFSSEPGGGSWEAVGTISGWDRTRSKDLNRAICECVAKWSHLVPKSESSPSTGAQGK